MTPPPDPNPTAPVEEKCATCGREEVWHRGSMHGFRKPAPAPEPKQGSAMKPRCAWEPGTPGECSAYLALRSRLAEVEAENKELQKCSCEAPFENDCPACLLPSRMNLKSEREALRAEVEKLQAQNASLQDTIDAHVGTDSMCRIGHERIRFEQGDTPPDVLACPMCNLRAQLEKAEARVREGADLLDRASRYCPNAAFLIEEIERYIRAARKGESR